MRVKWLQTFGLLVFTMLFAFAGCSGSSNGVDAGDGDGDGGGNGDTKICKNDTDCPNGQKCRGGICEDVTACDCNYDCGERSSNLICNRGSHECEAGTAPIDQCADDCDCYANETCAGSAGCVPTGGDGGCTDDEECQQGEKCLNGHCVPGPCTTRDDCAGAVCLVCTDGECTAPPPVCQGDQDCCVGFHCNFGACAEDIIGCQSDADCEEPTPRCVDRECMPQCVSDVDCDGGQICIDNHCVSPGCTPELCDTGEWCDPDAAEGMGACVPGCDSNDDCNAGELCNYATHQCIADCCGGCLATEYCDTQDCQCKTRCQTNPDDCGQGFKCNQQTGECEAEGGGEGTPCTDDAQCAEGLMCDMCSICWPLGRTATNTCLLECSVTNPCPRPTEQECEIGRLENQAFRYICIPI